MSSGFSRFFLSVSGILILFAVVNCNDHRFTPKSDIEVFPSSIRLEEQKGGVAKLDDVTSNLGYNEVAAMASGRKYRAPEILISNTSISSDLSVLEIEFEDENGNILETETSTALSDAEIGEVTYSVYGGPIEGAGCQEDAQCVEYGEGAICDTELKQCRTDIRFRFQVDYNLHELVNVDPSVIKDKDKAATIVYKPCYADFETVMVENENGEMVESAIPQPITKCEFYNKQGTGQCIYKFPADPEETVCNGMAPPKDVPTDEISALEKSLDVCLKNGDDVELYTLNRCDRLALVQRMLSVDDDNPAEGTTLENNKRSNYRLFRSSIDDYPLGQVNDVAHCQDELALSGDLWQLVDPMADEICMVDGKIDESKLSVNPDDVLIDQLPIALNYWIDSSYPIAAVLSQKNFLMRIRSTANIGGGAERTVSISINPNKGGPPEPVISLEDGVEAPEPLDRITLLGTNSTSPFGESRKPFQYWWRWGTGGRPQFANDAVLICSTCSFDTPVDIMNGWTDEGKPKIYLPISGTYIFDLKVKDSAGVESGPNTDCSDCDEWATYELDVRPSQKLHVELVWDMGNDVDMDIAMIRYRDDGTMGVPVSVSDKVIPDSPGVISCTTDADCPEKEITGGNFTCEGTSCSWSCTQQTEGDDDCSAYNGGWECGAAGSCMTNSDNEIYCDDDSDCESGHCSPKRVTDMEGTHICTTHSWEGINDTCHFTNTNPVWGDPSNPDNSPTLDIDDVKGYGPENISLKTPVPGRYRIVVRLYSGGSEPGEDGGPARPAVREDNMVTAYATIYVNGEVDNGNGSKALLEMKFSKTATYWKVADIEWTGEGEDGEGEVTVIPVQNAGGNFSTDPYANPYWLEVGSSTFDPNSSRFPASIWCDSASDMINATTTCGDLYAR